MQELKQPTVGRVVSYYPSAHEKETRTGAGHNGAIVVPAIVSQVFPWNEHYHALNLRILPDSNETLWQPSTPHKSDAHDGQAYWDWPEIK